MAQQNNENFVSQVEAQHLFILPKLEIPLKEMTESQLRGFVPDMLMYSMDSTQLDCKYASKPPWWPSDVQWTNNWTDDKSDISMQTSSYSTDALQNVVISCYKYHRREDLLSITGEVEAHKNTSQDKRNPLSTQEHTTEFHTICRLCLSNATPAIVDIFSFYDGEEIASIVSKHLWLQIFKGDGESDRLCSNCWMAIEGFHKLFEKVQQIHNSLPETFAKVQQIKEEPEESIAEFDCKSELEQQQNSNIDCIYEVTSVEEPTPENEMFFETGDNGLTCSNHSSDIETLVDEGISDFIPEKSKLAYESCYKNFCEWMKASKIKTVTEKVMLAYFLKRSKIAKSPTLWAEYSKLRCTINVNRNVDISKFTNVLAFLKRKSVAYVCKQSKMFTKTDFEKFLTEADDKEFLMMKVVLIIGIAGACRRDELMKLCTKDVVDTGDFVQIDIMDISTRYSRQFVITKDFMNNTNLLILIRKYMSLRTVSVHDRFFVGYRSGKCTSQPLGVNSIGGIPKKIATYLGLPDVEFYTGHCFRRSSPTLLADYGANAPVFKYPESWK